ncbi:MAG: hypothetical protein ACRDK5_07525 [Solirubrobacterales bacterium]
MIAPIRLPWTMKCSRRSAKKKANPTVVSAPRPRKNQTGRRQGAVGLAEPRAPGVRPLVLLIEQLQKGGLLLRRVGVQFLEIVLEPVHPRLHHRASPALLHRRPLVVDHGPPVTDQHALDGLLLGRREELGRSRQLHQGRRLLLGAAFRVVEALERLEHDEGEDDRERRAEEGEDPGAALDLDEEVIDLRPAPDEVPTAAAAATATISVRSHRFTQPLPATRGHPSRVADAPDG